MIDINLNNSIGEKSAENIASALNKENDTNSDNLTVETVDKKYNKKYKNNTHPGRLLGNVAFEIHTMDAQLLFSGYTDKNAVGLLQFAAQMTAIWDAAEKDNPYADWYLLKIYDAIIQLRNQFAQTIQDYQESIRKVYGRVNLTMVPFASEKPVVKNLWFRTQYGYLGAAVIGDFDELMRTVLTAGRVGVLLDKSQDVIRSEWIEKIVSLFKLPLKWKSFGLTRSDIASDNELAKTVIQALGRLPANVLDKMVRAPFSPYINIETNKIKNEDTRAT